MTCIVRIFYYLLTRGNYILELQNSLTFSVFAIQLRFLQPNANCWVTYLLNLSSQQQNIGYFRIGLDLNLEPVFFESSVPNPSLPTILLIRFNSKHHPLSSSAWLLASSSYLSYLGHPIQKRVQFISTSTFTSPQLHESMCTWSAFSTISLSIEIIKIML